MKPALTFQTEGLSQCTQPAVHFKHPVAGGALGRMHVGQGVDPEEALEWFSRPGPSGAMNGADEGSMGALVDKEGEAVEAAAVDPPQWEPKRNLVPGSCCAKVGASPRTTFRSLGDFFRSHLAAEVDTRAWALIITAFLDYVAIDMKVSVHRDAAGDFHTVVFFQHTSQDDLIQFNHVCSFAMKYLSACSLQVSEFGGVRCPYPMMSDDDFHNEVFTFEEWPVLFESAFDAVRGPEKSAREEGVQALARWAELRRDCIPVLAGTLIKHGRLVGTVLKGPLAECYPLAVALKFASRGPREAEWLAESILPLLPWPNSVLPSLVARELEETFKNLSSAAEAAGRGAHKAAESHREPPKTLEEDLSPTSTCTGDPWGFGSSWSQSESSRSTVWESQKSCQGPQWIRGKSETLVLSEAEDDFTGDLI